MSVPVFTCVPNRNAGVLTCEMLKELQTSGSEDHYFICKGDLLKNAGVDLRNVLGLAAVSDENTHVVLHKDDHALLVAEAKKVRASSAKVEEARVEVDTLKALLDQQAAEMKGLSRSISKRQTEKEVLEAELKTCRERLCACNDDERSSQDTPTVAVAGLRENFRMAEQDATARHLEKHDNEIAQLKLKIQGMMSYKKN